MNPVELYKKLPKTNCGACVQKACMPFAFALLKGEATLAECPFLSADLKTELAPLLRTSDWREDIIAGLEQEVKGISFAEVAPDLGATVREKGLFLKCFGSEVVVRPDGMVESQRRLTPWMRMLVLFYIRNRGKGDLSGAWVEHSELRGGLMKSKAFTRECEEPLRGLLDRHLPAATAILTSYGATHPGGFSAPHVWLVHLMPKLPVVIQYWPAEDEFESQVRIRFDSTADRHFDVEQLIFLVEELVKDIEAALQQDSG